MNIVLTAGENPFQLEVTEYHHDPQLVNIHQFFPALEHNFARAVSGRLGEERQVSRSCQKGCTERGKIQVCWFSKYEKDCVYYTWKTCVPFDLYLQSTLLLPWVKLLKFHGGCVGWMVDYFWWVTCFLLVCLWLGDLCMPYDINNFWIMYIYMFDLKWPLFILRGSLMGH